MENVQLTLGKNPELPVCLLALKGEMGSRGLLAHGCLLIGQSWSYKEMF